MYSSVPDDALLRAFAAASPDMNTLDVSSFDRLACRDDLSIVWVGSCEITDPLVVVGNRMVRVEPSDVRSCTRCCPLLAQFP